MNLILQRRRGGSDTGAAAVEFALVLIPLLLLVLGLIDFGRFFNQQIALTALAREGARLEALGYPDVTSRILVAAPASLNLQASQIALTPCVKGAVGTTDASVTITYPFAFTAVSLTQLPSSFTVTSRGSMPCLG